MAETSSCLHETLPCSESITGNLFLVAVYAFILAFGAKNIAHGSEILMEVRLVLIGTNL